MMVDIFIKSCKRDFKLLSYALKSISKNVSGYNNVILLIPENEKHDFDTRELPERTVVYYVGEYGNGYMFQQWCKMNAYNYSHAPYILFSDSDVIFDHPINLIDFIQDGKPEILYTDWSKVGDAICWKEPTEKFLKDNVPFEFMRRNCLVYHRDTLESIARFCPTLERMIMSSTRFSEFNAIGSFCYTYEREKYNFINTDEWEYVEPKGVQLWSLGNPFGDPVHRQEYQRTLDTINKVFDLQLTQI